MAERSNGKKSTSGTTLDLMGEEEPAPPRAARKAAAPAPAQAAPAETGGALFGGDEVDLDARHPADVPVGNFPAPSQIAQAAPADADAGDPFAEDDPFEDTVMARMLADEPAPLASPLRAAREEFNLRTDDEAPPVEELPAEDAPASLIVEAAPVMEAITDPVTEPAVEAVAEPDLEAFAEPVAAPEVEQKVEQEKPMPPTSPAPAAKPTAPPKTAATKNAKTNAPGLTIPRRYTQPGQDVWSNVEWELRTASIVGSDGTVVFEQKGVEIPKAWSQLATNVVVSKYFRGQIGTLEREYSVKQLIGRVADRILEWGNQGGYFATDADADAFHDELRFILLHQYAAFNSPVWFNLGWAGRRQAVSACYINEVQDTMESILDLYKTEGMLFKDGSGCTSGDSLVHVRDAGFLPIRNLYKKFLAEGRPVHEFDGKGRYIEVGDADVYTLSINPENGRFGQDQVLRVWQYDLPQEDKLTVRLDTGAKATVSCWHPFLVWDGEKITHRRADQLRRGDAVLGPNASAQAAVPTRPTTFEYHTTYFDRDESHVVTLDEDLAWLCGYFMGDGSLGAKQSRVRTTSGRLCTYDSLRLRFYDETEDTLRRVQQIIGRVFGEHANIRRGQCCPMLTYNGRRVTRFFEQLFGVGSKTYSLSMPTFVWNSPRAVQLAFLAGLIDSDGYVAEGGRAKYSSASREFAGHVAALASFLGLGGGAVEDRHVTTATILHRVASGAQRREFAAHLAHPERRRKLLETCSDKPQRKFCLPLSENIAHDLFGSDRAPAGWLSVSVGESTFHLGRLKYGGLINPLKLQKALAALGRDDGLTRLLTQVAESASFVFSVEPCREDPDFYDLTVRDHNNYLAGENGLVVIHNSGLNLSTLRSSKEPLEAGGRSSGPISFMKGLDASAGSIKSGGSCLAPWTRVYTERGPVAVSDLVGKDFIALSYDPPAGRYKAKRAQAWHAGTKRVVRLTTDKGQFDLSYDHPVRLADGRYVPCEQIRPGQSLFHCKVDEQMGYVRVGLRRGRRDSEHHRKLHQLIAEDVLGWDLHGMSLHHCDADKHNNDPANLSLMAQADHAGLHSRTQMAEGSHVFQNQRFSHTGQDNGMAVGSAFWQDTEKADRYRQVQGRALRESGRAPKMHTDAMRAKMLNKAYAVLSEGLSVDTPEDYFHGCIRIGRRCPSKAQFLDAVQNNFGGYEAFLAELKVHNHRAISVETLGVMDVYDVEVDCPTADDKSPQTGHNFVIWPDDSRFGTGIAVANTRRAACMRVLDIDHPDVKEFIDCKKDAEEKAHALIDAGYSGAFNVAGGAYDTVPFQNANHSVRVTDAFMRAVEADAAWDTKFRLSGRSAETYRARDLMRGIAEGTWTCGDPGMQYDTTINDWHTCADTDRIYASNPCCFVGETLIETAEGQVPFAALYIRHEAGEVLPSVFSFERHNRRPVLRSIRKVWIAGHTQHLVEVKTERGLTFRCTPEHRFLTQEGTYVEAQHLSTGTALCSLRCAAKDLPENKEALQAMLAEAADVLLAVTPLTLDAPVPVYDMEVEDTHNFAITDARSAGQTSIVVSNSEFMFLNSTACNLSSLNLMKFRQEGTGAFDTESFEHAVAVMITAQEIVVGFASYPTPKIEQRSHEYRPLGLGYANLGALLMAAGLPYDSDAGRAYAGAVTALMTGRAYHQSAAIARDCGGPFSGFAPNRASMLRVMGKHRAAVDDISPALIPDTLLAAARTAWDEAVAEGQASGYRNAQASVLAPTGCLVAGSLVVTDRGVIRLNRLGDVDGAQWQDVGFSVLTDEGWRQATKFYVNGRDQTRRVTTHCGYAIQGTPKHRVKVVNPQTGQWDWKRFADIAAGDIVPLSLGQMIGAAQAVALPPLGEEYWTGDYATRVPRTMTADLAELIGYFMGDGSMHSKGPRFCVANTDLDVAERVKVLVKSLFNLDAHLTPQQGYCEVAVHSVPLTLWWEACGFSKAAPGPDHSGKGYLPRIPDAILATNDPAVYGAFLRGLYEADGTVTGGIPCWSTVHREFSDEVKTLLLALGVPTTTRRTVAGWSRSPIYVLRLRNASYTGRYLAAVGFMGARKAESVSRGQSEQTARHDYVYLSPAVLRELLPRSGELANALLLAMKRHEGTITRRAAQALLERTGDSRLAHALRFFYDAVTANEDGGEQLTYDLSVPGNVTYVANGFVSHNTIGFLMDCDTTGIEPDIAIVKYKSLVGGGMMKIVNQTVPEALQRLGYDEAQVEGILKFIDEHDTVEGAPDLKPEHLPIFDCAFRPMNGTRSIHYRGHIKMMAAAQPFISGAISKTVNVPNDATPEDIAETYLESWKLGIKAVAIYRDGSKRTQPLNTSKEAPAKEKTAQATEAAAPAAPLAPPKAVRRRLPDERAGVTHKFSIGGHEGYLTVGLYPDTNQPGEIFIRMSKEGSSISGLMDSFATAISLALQYGVPLSTLVDKFIHSRFEPSGFTGNKEIPMAKSVMDYIFRYLALRFLQKEDRHNVGLLADQDDSAYAAPAKLPAPPPPPAHDAKSGSLSNGNGKNGNGGPKSGGDLAHLAETNTAAITDHEREIYRMQSDAPPCPECGAITIRSGACYKCLSCGTSLGCS